MNQSNNKRQFDYDFIVIGSGFGGSVSALRLSEKGYRVLVIEKGKWFRSEDFPKTNWHLTRWLWMPLLRFFGFFKITFMKHITILSGVGVGGGSLVYANTLPVPKREFFEADSWSHLAEWETELKPHYDTAQKMLGAASNPRLETGDLALQQLAREIGKNDRFESTNVAVYFGEAGKKVPDPYFDGKGPERSGCTFCGGCMTGCLHDAKNTLDKNDLYLARLNGAEIQAESEVIDVRPLGRENGSDGYEVIWRQSVKPLFLPKKHGRLTAGGIVFAGGVLGTVKLLLKLRKRSLPNLSDRIGYQVRTNSESLIGVTTFDKKNVFSDGVAIGSILHTDKYSHLEPVRYAEGSGFWRLLMSPQVHGKNAVHRVFKLLWDLL